VQTYQLTFPGSMPEAGERIHLSAIKPRVQLYARLNPMTHVSSLQLDQLKVLVVTLAQGNVNAYQNTV